MVSGIPGATEEKGQVSRTTLPDPIPLETPESLLGKASAAAERLEAANKKAEEIAARNEAAAARMMIAGRAAGGQAEVKKEETPKEYKDRIMKGSV